MTLDRGELMRGVVPDGWTSVFDQQPEWPAFYEVIASVGSMSPKVGISRVKFSNLHGLDRWHEGDWVKVLAWRC
jgi:hypothetical protein